MKKYINKLSVAALLLGGLALTSCSEDKLNEESVITVPKAEENQFDKWLKVNFVDPYNIQFKYRYEEIESDFGYYTVPAYYDMAVEMAHLVKYICIDSYNEVAGVDFTRAHFPKEFFLIGEWEYKNNGSFILGTAEGGKKILLTGVNYLDLYKNNMADLTHYYLKTIHHEFTHILNQTRPMPTDFQFVSGDTYVGGEWANSPYDTEDYFRARGHISAYSQQEYGEDFAEMVSIYVCYPESQWQAWLKASDAAAAKERETNTEFSIQPSERISEKLSIVKRYMLDTWGIDLDKLREVIQRREAEIKAGKVSLTDLSI